MVAQWQPASRASACNSWPIARYGQPSNASSTSALEIFAETGADDLEVHLAFTTLLAYMIGQLWLDDLGTGPRTSELETLQDATGSLGFTSDEVFAYGIETVLAGLRARLDKA